MDDPAREQGNGGFKNFSKPFQVAGPLFGAGIQLAAAVVVFFFAGRWLDAKFNTSPWFMLIGALVGVGAGLYKFIRTAEKVGSDDADGNPDDEKR